MSSVVWYRLFGSSIMKSLKVHTNRCRRILHYAVYDGHLQYHFCMNNLIRVPLAQSTTKYCNLFRMSFESMEISITICGLYATEILFETLAISALYIAIL